MTPPTNTQATKLLYGNLRGLVQTADHLAIAPRPVSLTQDLNAIEGSARAAVSARTAALLWEYLLRSLEEEEPWTADAEQVEFLLTTAKEAATAAGFHTGDVKVLAEGCARAVRARQNAQADAFHAVRQTLLETVTDCSHEEMRELKHLICDEMDSRRNGELIILLRWLVTQDAAEFNGSPFHDSPVLKIEFSTYTHGENLPEWNDRTFHLHRENSTITQFEWHEGDDPVPGFSAKVARFDELMAQYSQDEVPVEGTSLFVDLTTGEFEVTGN